MLVGGGCSLLEDEMEEKKGNIFYLFRGSQRRVSRLHSKPGGRSLQQARAYRIEGDPRTPRSPLVPSKRKEKEQHTAVTSRAVVLFVFFLPHPLHRCSRLQKEPCSRWGRCHLDPNLGPGRSEGWVMFSPTVLRRNVHNKRCLRHALHGKPTTAARWKQVNPSTKRGTRIGTGYCVAVPRRSAPNTPV